MSPSDVVNEYLEWKSSLRDDSPEAFEKYITMKRNAQDHEEECLNTTLP